MLHSKNNLESGSDAYPVLQWLQPKAPDFECNEALIHIWRIQWKRLNPAVYLKFLNPQERLKSSSYHRSIDQQRFIIGRGVLKELSACYLKTSHKSLNCVKNSYGKPYFSTPHNHLQFNISHSEEIILIAFGYALPTLGIDLEQVNPEFDYSDIVEQYFSESEKQRLRCENPAEQFFRIWTRKEALAKAAGKGLTDEALAFDVSADEAGHSFNYHLRTFEIDKGFVFSLAGAYVPEKIRCFDYSPSIV